MHNHQEDNHVKNNLCIENIILVVKKHQSVDYVIRIYQLIFCMLVISNLEEIAQKKKEKI